MARSSVSGARGGSRTGPRHGDGARRGRRTTKGTAARHVAARVLRRILGEALPLDEAMARETARLAALAPRDRALAGSIVRTALRRRGQIEDVLRRFLRRPLPAEAEYAHALLLTAATQILFMRVPAHAAIDTAVTLAGRERATRHLTGLLNAVLRRVATEGPDIVAAQDPFLLNVPEWLRRAWVERTDEATARAMAEAMLAEPPLDLTPKVADEAATWARRLGAMLLPTGTLRLEAPGRAVTVLPGYDAGAWWVQDAAAALPARLLGNVAGRRVLDLCAAPGGKTAQLAAAGGAVTAVDISERRLARLRENLARLDLTAEIVRADVRHWRPPAPADAVLLDAPCTATGTARRHPEVTWLKTPAQMRELTALQDELLERAAQHLRPGGCLVYCVCSLQAEEGEARIDAFLRRRRDYARLPVRPREVAGQRHFLTPAGDVRTLPHMPIGAARGLDGFYIARLQRREGDAGAG